MKNGQKHFLTLLVLASLNACSNHPNLHVFEKSYTARDTGEEDATACLFPVDSDSLFYPYPDKKQSYWNIKNSQDSLKKRLVALDERYQKSKPKEILIFIHGGMNREVDGIDAAGRAFKNLTEGNEDIMPIFITWDSGLFSSYGRHLLGDANGVSYMGTPGAHVRGAFRTVLNLPTDLATGIVQTPRTLVDGFIKTAEKSDKLFEFRRSLFPTKKAYATTLASAFKVGPDENGFSRRGGTVANVPWNVSLASGPAPYNPMSAVESLANLPLTVGLSPAYQGIGRQAWENMTRRSHTLVHRYPTMVSGADGVESGEKVNRQRAADGVAAYVFEQVSSWQKKNPSLKITVAGHSMGTMVLNEVFRGMEPTRSGSEKSKGSIPHVRIQRIIYLAAACSIRDFNDTAGQYLMRNAGCRCYNLCLHPRREVSETFRLGPTSPVLSGSLLVWIDEIFESPRDFQDRTFGSFENCIIAYRHMPHTRRFSLKGFSDDATWSGEPRSITSGPQKHGGFSAFRYWDSSFLEPHDPATPVSYPRQN